MTKPTPRPFDVRWNAVTRVFDVYLGGQLVGSHKGRGGADKIGSAAVKAKQQASSDAARAVSASSQHQSKPKDASYL